MASDRPRYHFQPVANWMNDPNGLIQWNGIYHLFYQYNPNGPLHGTIHWGHASSPDLVHWTHLPIALTPTPDSPDADGCWSGCAVDNNGVPTLMYTGITMSRGSTPPRETQCIATGDAALRSWTKHPGNPMIAAPPPDLEVIGFRDPFVWREGGGWACIVGTGIAGRGGAILLYRSPDLLRWEYRGLLCEGDATITKPVWAGSMWECPQFFPLGDKHVLIFSAWHAGKTHHTVYAIGDYAGDRFTLQTMYRLDLGPDFYAPATMSDDRGRRLMWGWLREARRKAGVVAAGWSGMQSLPRVLSLGADATLRMAPAPELEMLRGAQRHWDDLEVDDTASPLLIPEVQGDALELRVVFDLCRTSAHTFGLEVRRSPSHEEYTTIRFDRSSGALTLDREHASLAATSYRGSFSGPVDAAESDLLTLRIFLDRSAIEIYANDRACLAARVYPTRDDSTGVALTAQGGQVRLRSLDAWEMMDVDTPVTADGRDH